MFRNGFRKKIILVLAICFVFTANCDTKNCNKGIPCGNSCIHLNNGNDNKLMLAWNEMYPPKQWECDRNRQIEKIQGNDNKFISEKC